MENADSDIKLRVGVAIHFTHIQPPHSGATDFALPGYLLYKRQNLRRLAVNWPAWNNTPI